MLYYNIQASATTTDETIKAQMQFENAYEATKYARSCAEDLYNLNPKRDVLDIMKENRDIDESTAYILFQLDMIQNISYSAEEV